MRKPTMGNFFSGSGTWELAAEMCGIEVVFESEIEPFPVALEAKRFPNAIQLGDVAKVDGTKIPKVDIITSSSPCQDLSVAGKRAGLDGERSYHEFMYLAHDVPMRAMTDAEIIYMRNRSVKFASLILLSSLCVVLHREDGWGFERISKFLYRMDLVRKLLGDDEQKCMDFMRNNTGKDPKEMWM